MIADPRHLFARSNLDSVRAEILQFLEPQVRRIAGRICARLRPADPTRDDIAQEIRLAILEVLHAWSTHQPDPPTDPDVVIASLLREGKLAGRRALHAMQDRRFRGVGVRDANGDLLPIDLIAMVRDHDAPEGPVVARDLLEHLTADPVVRAVIQYRAASIPTTHTPTAAAREGRSRRLRSATRLPSANELSHVTGLSRGQVYRVLSETRTRAEKAIQ